MKKITLFIVTIFTVATLFAAARPSLDGRAVVAESGTMPKGLFARTVGYLPGDSVTVTNPATGSTIDVLILGAIDPSEGVAILLSPEAADGLRIRPESNVQVKLTKRSGSLDENANGSAVLSEGEEEKEAETAKSSEDEKNTEIANSQPSSSNEKPAVEEKSAAFAENSPAQSSPAEIIEEIPAVAESSVASESPAIVEEVAAASALAATPVLVAEKVVEEKKEPEVVGTVYEELPPLENSEVEKVVVVNGEPSVAPALPLPVVDEEKVEEAPLEEKVLVQERVEEELAKLEKEEDKNQHIEDVDYVEELVRSDAEIAPVKVEAVPTEVEKNPGLQPVIVVETEKVLPEEEVLQPVIEELPVLSETESVYEELPPGIETEPSVVAEENASESTDLYQPIVLVPTDMNPPSSEEKTEAKREVAKVEKAESDAVSESVTSEVSSPAPVTVTTPAPAEEKPVVSNDWKNYVVPSVRNLRSGYYYIQVASLGNVDNIKSLIDKYSCKYPLVLVQNSAKTAYQVMVGPLNIDEYGSVDEKFKAYGFKDSFVRKIR